MALISRREDEYSARVLRLNSNKPRVRGEPDVIPPTETTTAETTEQEAAENAERMHYSTALAMAMDENGDDDEEANSGKKGKEEEDEDEDDGVLVRKCSLCYRTLKALPALDLAQVRHYGLASVRVSVLCVCVCLSLSLSLSICSYAGLCIFLCVYVRCIQGVSRLGLFLRQRATYRACTLHRRLLFC
jgi:hypothetical protein